MFSIVNKDGMGFGTSGADTATRGCQGDRHRGKHKAKGADFTGDRKPPGAPRANRNRARYPVNLLESEIGEEVSELLAHPSLELTSGHQAWLLMAIMYLVERERRKAVNPAVNADRASAMARAESLHP